MDGTDRFLKHYNFPKQDKEERGKEQIVEDLRDYEEDSALIFAFFKELTGRRTNEDACSENLRWYLNEGFEIDDFVDYVKAQKNTQYYQQNPDRFFLKNLFPIGDKDRQSMVWDLMAFQQSLRKKPEKRVGLQILTKCGTKVFVTDYELHSNECFEKKGKCFQP